MNILIAEDDSVARQLLATILESDSVEQHHTTVAANGALAWELLDDPGRSFDALFLDLHMPKVDGFELLRRIRESPMLRSLPVILCTGAADRKTVLQAVQYGVRHFIAKPCTPEVVLAKLREVQPLQRA